MVDRQSFLQGEDIFITVSIGKEYFTDMDKLYAYVFFDDNHGLITSEDGEYIDMDYDAEKSEVSIHISHEITANAHYMPVGTYGLEIMKVTKDTEYRKIYQNKKQFDLKKSYIVNSGSKIINFNIAMALKNNQYQGETLDLIIEGDENFDFGESGTQPFKVFVYPDGLDTSIEANKEYIKIIDSRDVDGNAVYGDGYVSREENYTAHAFLPYYETQNMRTGSYTVEVLYGDESRSVNKFNNAFILVEGYSNEIQ